MATPTMPRVEDPLGLAVMCEECASNWTTLTTAARKRVRYQLKNGAQKIAAGTLGYKPRPEDALP